MASKFDDIKGNLNIGSELLRRKERESERVTSEVAKNLQTIKEKNQRIQEKTDSFDKLTQDLAETTLRRYSDLEAKRDELAYIAREQEKILNEVSRLENEIKTAQANVDRASAGSQQRAQNVFISSVRSAFSPRQVASNISQYQSSPSMYPRSISMAGRSSSYDLEQQLAKLRQEESRQRQNILEIGAEVEGRESEFTAATGAHQSIQQQIAQAQGALGIHRRQGTDIRGRYESAINLGNQVARDRGLEGVRELVSSGQAPSLRELQNNIKNTGDQIVETLKKFNSALESSPEKAEKLGEELSKLGEVYSHQKDLMKEVRASGGGGGWLSGQGTIISDMGRLVQAGSQMYRENYLTSEFAQTDARIGMARLAKQRYDEVHGAGMGDARSLLRVIGGAFAAQRRAGEQFGERTDIANMTQVIGKLGETIDQVGSGIMGNIDVGDVAGAAGAVMAGGPVAGIGSAALQIAGAGVKGVAQAAPNIIDSNRMLTDIRKDISRSMNYIQRANQMGQLQDALGAIDYETVGSALQYRDNITLATRGMGGRRAGMAGQLAWGTNTFNRLTELGLSPEQIVGLTGAGRSSLGGEYRGALDLETAQVLARGGTLESPEQYLQARSMLSTGGGRASDLAEVMQKAIAAGMDESKNIMQMVEATTQMSSRSAQMGATTIGGLAGGMGIGAANLLSMGVTRDQVGSGLLAGRQFIQDKTTSREMTIGNIIESAELDRISGMTFTAKQRLQTMDLPEIMSIVNNPSLADQYGLGSLIGGDSGKARGIAKAISKGSITDQLTYFLDKPALDKVIAANARYIETGNPQEIPPELRETVFQILGASGANASAVLGELGITWKGAAKPPKQSPQMGPVQTPAPTIPATVDISPQGTPGSVYKTSSSVPSTIDEMLQYARGWEGTPYKWGGESAGGIDCSGFVQKVLDKGGMDPAGDQSASGLYDHFREYGTPLEQGAPGAVVFHEDMKTGKITHTGIMTGASTMIDASGRRGVSERSSNIRGYKSHIFMPKYPALTTGSDAAYRNSAAAANMIDSPGATLGSRGTRNKLADQAAMQMDKAKARVMAGQKDKFGREIKYDDPMMEVAKQYRAMTTEEQRKAYTDRKLEEQRALELGRAEYERSVGWWDRLTEFDPSDEQFRSVGYRLMRESGELKPEPGEAGFMGPVLGERFVAPTGEQFIDTGERGLAARAKTQAGRITAGGKTIQDVGGLETLTAAAETSAASIESAGHTFAAAVQKAAQQLKLPKEFDSQVASLNNTLEKWDEKLKDFYKQMARFR